MPKGRELKIRKSSLSCRHTIYQNQISKSLETLFDSNSFDFQSFNYKVHPLNIWLNKIQPLELREFQQPSQLHKLILLSQKI